MALVNGEGPVPSDALILGEAPGADEEQTGRPFVGASGKLLDRALDAAGVSRAEVYITNAYKLRPPGNRTPTKAELEKGHNALLKEFATVNPSKVLLLGSVARDAISGVDFVRRGEWAFSKGRRRYMWVYHPAYLLYTGQRGLPEWKDQIRRFFHELPEHPKK